MIWTLFYVFAAVAIGASLLVIGQRNPIYSVLLLIASFGALAGLYVLLDAPFVAVTQIIVYRGRHHGALPVRRHAAERAGGRSHRRDRPRGPQGARWMGAALAVALLFELGWALTEAGVSGQGVPPFAARGGQISSVRFIGQVLFRNYAFAFEATSILIIVAMVGAVLLARRATPDEPMATLNHYLVLSAILFSIGTAGVFLRRNLITILLAVEIMLNAVNLTFVAFGRFLNSVDGQIIVFFVITVAAAEAAVGLAIVIAMFRHRAHRWTRCVHDVEMVKTR